MKLYSRDFQVLTQQEMEEWERLKEKEWINKPDRPKVIRSEWRNFPKAARHFPTLFPNNWLDDTDLRTCQQEYRCILEQFATLLENPNTTERTILNFIRDQQAYFLIGALLHRNYNFGHHDVYLFPEFELGASYVVDYLLVGRNSNGHEFVFVELENPYKHITNKDGTLGRTFRKGVSQIELWNEWIEANYSHLLPVFAKYQNKDSQLPKEFYQLDKTRIHYAVVGGRRKDFQDKTYRTGREMKDDKKILLLHYDNIYDCACNIIDTNRSTY